MTKFLLSLSLLLFILLCFSQDEAEELTKLYQQADKLYHDAELTSDETQQDELNRKALEIFRKILAGKSRLKSDSLAFYCYLKAGVLEAYFDNLSEANNAYNKALQFKNKVAALDDSVFFKPLLYSGIIHYNQDQLDSALSRYKQAEAISEKYANSLTEIERLFNNLGVIYYETGNYRQAKNYFEKAIAVLTASGKGNEVLLVNYKINIASLLIKLENYTEAKSVYESILPLHVFTDEINHNLGIISLKQQEYKNSINYFEKVNYKNSSKVIDLYYNLAVAWSGLHENDSSEFYLQQALAENIKWNGHRKNIPYGLILRYQAEELISQKEYKKAIEACQQAIMQFDVSFNETDIYKNPDEFGTVFSYINLFNTLTAKADAMELLYNEQKQIELLKGSQDTYRSAFNLADYVEKTYNSDESRLFLNKIKYTVHSKPIDISLQLYELTGQKKYLEDAYIFDQQNKASILALNVQENELRKSNSSNKIMMDEEASIKTTITRLLLKLSRVTDSQQVQVIQSSIRDNEIKLGKLQEKIKEDPDYRNKYFITQIPSVSQLQKKLDEKTAILSYHLSDTELLILQITANRLEYYNQHIEKEFLTTTDSLKAILQSASDGEKYNGALLSAKMYQLLIKPLEAKLSNIRRLVIIPDDELNYLPFEALQDENGKYLIEKYSVQYQYSTALWGNVDSKKKEKASGILAFAPFVTTEFTDSNGMKFTSLPASKDETGSLKGEILTDSLAIKNNFIVKANHYGTIHLATHASADNEMPLRSFIAFYPETGVHSDDYRLYAQEIYDMNLDSTQLIILSACETGTGQLVKGEGLMSLSRAFAYAGCPNIITSLWKAEDKTTAFITQRLHYYLEKGLLKDKALQKAKLDLLSSDEIDPRFKTPNYWAHLIFIGNYENDHKRNNWWWIAVGIIIAAIMYRSVKPKNLPAKGRQV